MCARPMVGCTPMRARRTAAGSTTSGSSRGEKRRCRRARCSASATWSRRSIPRHIYSTCLEATMAVGEWDQRQLCPDGACVGVIGPDGTCKVCGRAAPNWGDERKRGLIDPPDEDAGDDDDDLDDDELAADGDGADGDGDEYDDDDDDDDAADDDGHGDGDRAG